MNQYTSINTFLYLVFSFIVLFVINMTLSDLVKFGQDEVEGDFTSYNDTDTLLYPCLLNIKNDVMLLSIFVSI